MIVAGARTPVGKFGGAFKDVPAVSLGAHAMRAALERAGVEPGQVDYVIMGQVLQAGAGQITARQAAIEAGIPQEVPAITINKVCLSGLNAIALADQLIRAGEVEVVVAGGMESMSEAPYLVPKARFGARMGNTEMIDSMVHDGLWSTFTEQSAPGRVVRWPKRWCQSKCVSSVANRSRSGATKVCVREQRWSLSRGSHPLSRRTARSRPAMRRRSQTA